MESKPDILCLSSTDWDGIWGSRQQVMRRFARRGYRVLFVERPIGLEHWLRYPAFRQRKRRRWQEGMREVEPRLNIVSLPLLPPGRYYSMYANRLSQLITLHFVTRYLKKVDFAEPILWTYNPHQGFLIGKLGEQLSVYHCIDEWTAGTGERKKSTIQLHESELLSKVELVFANSPTTYAAKRKENTHTYRIPSGVDFAHFALSGDQELITHPILEEIPKPRIGYSGLVNDRLDYDVLTHLAQIRPEWSLVLIGDTHPWTMDAKPLRHLQQFDNVYFLGKQPFAQMPQLLIGLDLCLMPYINDDRGVHRSPLKLYEYFAAGKPVVSTPHPEASEFSELVLQAETPEQFAVSVDCALGADTPEKRQQRIQVAEANSWDSRVDLMEQILWDHITH